MADLLNRKQVAALFNVKPWAIDSWCRKGILPYEAHPCGKRFDPDEIARYRASRHFGPHLSHDTDSAGGTS